MLPFKGRSEAWLQTSLLVLAALAAYLSYQSHYNYALYLLIGPTMVGALFYGRRFYGIMLLLPILTAIGLGAHLWREAFFAPTGHLAIIILVAIAVVVVSEFIMRLSRAQSRAVVAAQEEEAKYRLLFEAGPEPVFIYDFETLQLLAVNNAMIARYGYSREDLLSMALPDIVYPDDVPRLKETLQEIKLEEFPPAGVREVGLRRHRAKDGAILWVRIFAESLEIRGRAARLVLAQDLTDRKRAEDDVRSITAGARCVLWRATVEETSEGFQWDLDVPDEEAAQRLVPLDVPSGQRYADVWLGSKLQEDLPRAKETFIHAAHSGLPGYTQEYRCRQTDGQIRWLLEDVQIETVGLNRWRLFGVCTDITDRKNAEDERLRAEEALRASEERYRQLVELSPDAICIHTDGKIVFVNTAMVKMMGASNARDLLGKPIIDVIHPDFRAVVEQRIAHVLEAVDEAPLLEEKWIRLDGSVIDVDVAAIHFTFAGQPAVQVVSRDITERKQADDIIRHRAYHDPLTGLPNRSFFNDRLMKEIARARRIHSSVAVLFLDTDNFKLVNDTLGHSGGDALLEEMAVRLQVCVRESDTVARMGGDEFTLLLPDISGQDDAVRMAHRILESVKRPFVLNGQEILTTISVGISVFPENGNDAKDLLRTADTALYRAKERGGNHYELFTESMNARAMERLTLESRLRQALAGDELTVHYQPQVNVHSGEIVGVEALLRWNSPELGVVPPSRFIPVAEENGLILPLGEWVLRKACEQNAAWLKEGHEPLRIAVNLSARQFRESGFVKMVEKVLEDTGIPPGCVLLEVTENMVMQYVDDTISKLRDLKEMGVRVSIDDFGTGSSSLSYLKLFDISALKIDQSFVSDIKANSGEAPGDTAIARAIIGLAHSLNVTVTAEGVETEHQAAFLQSLDCDEMQGHWVGYPLPPAELNHLLWHDGHRLTHVKTVKPKPQQ